MIGAYKPFLLLSIALLAAGGASAQPAWVEVTPMPTPRAFASVAVLDGQIYVIGGRNAAGQPLDVVERYDPVTNSWSTVDGLRDERFNASAAVFNGQILLTGGRADGNELTDDVEVFDPIEQRWESFDHLQDEREGHGTFSVADDVYVFGGFNEVLQYRDDAEVYNEINSEWDDYGFWTLDTPRASFASVPDGDGVLIYGGFGNFGPVAEVEHYVPNQAGTLRAPIPEPRGSLAGARLEELTYAIGGRNAANDVVARVDAYDSGLDSWDSSWPDLPEPREGAVAATAGNSLFVFGGQTDIGHLPTTALMLTTMTASEQPAPQGTFSVELIGPNPFADAVALSLSVGSASFLTVDIYDMLGRRVAEMAKGPMPPGKHTLVWDGRDGTGRLLPVGPYVVRVQDGARSETLKITRMR